MMAMIYKGNRATLETGAILRRPAVGDRLHGEIEPERQALLVLSDFGVANFSTGLVVEVLRAFVGLLSKTEAAP